MFSRDKFIYDSHVEADPSNSRYRLAQFAQGSRAILDVGCATGYIGAFLRTVDPQKRLVGIELDRGAAEQARPYYDQIVIGNVDEPETWEQVEGKFGAMIFGDVLEHTKDPVAVLNLAKPLLNVGGRVIISVPNIVYVRSRIKILLGKFDYEESGIMDRTHLRFFTCKTVREMLQHAGFHIVHMESIYGYPPPKPHSPAVRLRSKLRALVRSALARRIPGLFAYQFIVVGVMPPQPTSPEG